MVLKCESYPGAGYQQQTYMMVRESDGYSQNGYNGTSGMPMGHAQSHEDYNSHMPVYQQGHTEQKHHSDWGHNEQKHHSDWGHNEQKQHSDWGHNEQKHHSGWGHSEQKHPSGWETSPGYGNGYYNSAPSTMFSGGMPQSEGYANHYQGSKHGHMGGGSGHSGWGNGHSGYSHGSSDKHGHGGNKKTWTLKGLEDEE